MRGGETKDTSFSSSRSSSPNNLFFRESIWSGQLTVETQLNDVDSLRQQDQELINNLTRFPTQEHFIMQSREILLYHPLSRAIEVDRERFRQRQLDIANG